MHLVGFTIEIYYDERKKKEQMELIHHSPMQLVSNEGRTPPPSPPK